MTSKMACGFPESLLRAKEAGVLTREEMEICAKRILRINTRKIELKYKAKKQSWNKNNRQD